MILMFNVFSIPYISLPEAVITCKFNYLDFHYIYRETQLYFIPDYLHLAGARQILHLGCISALPNILCHIKKFWPLNFWHTALLGSSLWLFWDACRQWITGWTYKCWEIQLLRGDLSLLGGDTTKLWPFISVFFFSSFQFINVALRQNLRLSYFY